MNYRKSNGYLLIYRPDSPSAQVGTHQGWAYEHRVVIEDDLGHPIPEGYEVHHLDFDPTNNHIDNLIVLSKKDHIKLHKYLEHGLIPKQTCQTCGTEFRSRNKRYCSDACYRESLHRCKHPTKEELSALVWELPFTKIGKRYGVSDNAVRKWCKSYGITHLPPRGYFLRKDP